MSRLPSSLSSNVPLENKYCICVETSPCHGCMFRQNIGAYDFGVRWDFHHAIGAAIRMREQKLTSLSLLLWEQLFFA